MNNILGFAHSAFTFAHESLVSKSTVSQSDVPPGALITFLQKGLEYVGIEEHIAEVGLFSSPRSGYFFALHRVLIAWHITSLKYFLF
jgi:hypothetical protein